MMMATDVDMATFLWVAGTLFAVIGALIALVCKIAWDAIQGLKDKNEELNNKLSDRIGVLYSKVDEERKERVRAHNTTTERIFTEFEKLRDRTDRDISNAEGSIADLRETVAGFGSIYVTRKEWIDEGREG